MSKKIKVDFIGPCEAHVNFIDNVSYFHVICGYEKFDMKLSDDRFNELIAEYIIKKLKKKRKN